MTPSGWRAVPVEPTPKMIERYNRSCNSVGRKHLCLDAYRAMLTAAPSPPSAEPLPDISKAREWINEIRAWALGSAGATKKDILEYADRALAILAQQPSPPPSDALRAALTKIHKAASFCNYSDRPAKMYRDQLAICMLTVDALLAAPSAAATEKTARELELEDVLTSARCIAERNGENTAWDRFSARIARLGISGVTAKVFKVLPSDQAAPSAGSAGQAVEMSPEFTDTSRSALLWVLWHHQGGNSPVGQAVRFALGMGQFQDISDQQIQEAKKWNAVNPEQPVDQQARQYATALLNFFIGRYPPRIEEAISWLRRTYQEPLAHPETPNKEPDA